jgi:Nas2 N_terminal domain
MATTPTNQQSDEEAVLRKVLATLDVQRKAMENEADAIYLELTTPPEDGIEPMGVDTPLVDPEGYPRGDIDVYRARTLRSRFRILQTDHKETSQRIEALLVQLAALNVRCLGINIYRINR